MTTPDLSALPALPRDDEGPTFRAPWEAQAFAIAVLLHERGHFTWKEWAARLDDEIAAARDHGEVDDGPRYYHYWLATLEKIVAAKRIVLADELRARRDRSGIPTMAKLGASPIGRRDVCRLDTDGPCATIPATSDRGVGEDLSMTGSIDRRAFLGGASVGATAALLGAPLVRRARAAAGERVVVAVGQWGTETPFAWRTVQAEKPLWDCVYDSLIMRDPRTFEYRPGLATEWKPSNQLKTWTFKLRSGVKFHEGWGELTAEDVKFTVEQNAAPDAGGGSAPFFRSQLDRIETPDRQTVAMHFKSRVWEVPSLFTQFVGYQNITSKKYLETVGEQKAALHPIGTGPYRHVEGRQGDYHRFEAVPNHWRKRPAFKELVIRRVPEPATRLSGLRAGEIDIAPVFGDYLDQASKAGFRIHEVPNAACYWVILSGQTTPERDDYCPSCPWAGDAADPRSRDNARKVRLAMNLAVNKKAIITALWKGKGAETPFSYYYYPFNKGYSADWKIPPCDPERAKRLLAEAGVGGGFEVRVNPMVTTYAVDGPDVMEAVALDWEKIGIKAKRFPEMSSTFGPKSRMRKTNKTHWVYGSPPFDEPVLAWSRIIHSRGAFNLLCDGGYDEEIDTVMKELDVDRRAKLTHDLGQKLYDGYHGVMLGTKSITWALSKQVASWQTLAYVPLETNYEYIDRAG